MSLSQGLIKGPTPCHDIRKEDFLHFHLFSLDEGHLGFDPVLYVPLIPLALALGFPFDLAISPLRSQH